MTNASRYSDDSLAHEITVTRRLDLPPVAIAPSILSADFTRLGTEVRAVTQAGAHLIHLDVMDGHMVPNITMGPDIVAAVKRCTHLPLDVHLMIEHPERYVSAFVAAGANIVTVHAEVCVHLHRVLQQIKETGAHVGVSLNPATPLSVLEHVLEDVDLILIMTVNPGFGGQKPIPAAIRKLEALQELLHHSHLSRLPVVEVDGGVKVENAVDFRFADVLVSGSGVFHHPMQEAQQTGVPKEALDEAGLTASYRRVMEAMVERLAHAHRV